MGDMVWMGVENLICTGKNNVDLKVLTVLQNVGNHSLNTVSHPKRHESLMLIQLQVMIFLIFGH